MPILSARALPVAVVAARLAVVELAVVATVAAAAVAVAACPDHLETGSMIRSYASCAHHLRAGL